MNNIISCLVVEYEKVNEKPAVCTCMYTIRNVFGHLTLCTQHKTFHGFLNQSRIRNRFKQSGRFFIIISSSHGKKISKVFLKFPDEVQLREVFYAGDF